MSDSTHNFRWEFAATLAATVQSKQRSFPEGLSSQRGIERASGGSNVCYGTSNYTHDPILVTNCVGGTSYSLCIK